MITKEEMNAVGQSGLKLYELTEKALSAETWREALAEKTRELNAMAENYSKLAKDFHRYRDEHSITTTGWVQKETYDALKSQLIKSDHEVDVQKEIIADKDAVNKCLREKLDAFRRWQTEVLTARTGWEAVDSYIRNHPDAILGDYVHETCLKWLKERDEVNDALFGK